MPALQVSRTQKVSWEHPVLVQKGIGFSSASQARKGIAKRDADSQFSLPPHEVAPAGAAGAACPAAAKSG